MDKWLHSSDTAIPKKGDLTNLISIYRSRPYKYLQFVLYKIIQLMKVKIRIWLHC